MLDRSHLNAFYAQIPDRDALPRQKMADIFAYYLQAEIGKDSITTAELKECFRLCDLPVPTWAATHLSNASKGRKAKYVKAKLGYRLHAREREALSKIFGVSTASVQSSASLRAIFEKLPEGARKEFLWEAIECYSHGCNRAAVVMFWLFLMDHLFDLVLTKHLPAFNVVLAANTDKRVKVTSVAKRDDFGEIPEGKFVEFLKSAGIITNDVRKILDQKLGTRNTAAHPSTVALKQSKANEFFEDLIENVYEKYPI